MQLNVHYENSPSREFHGVLESAVEPGKGLLSIRFDDDRDREYLDMTGVTQVTTYDADS